MRVLTRSAKRAKRFHLGLIVSEGFRLPRTAPRGSCLARDASCDCGARRCAPSDSVAYFAVQRAFYRAKFEEHRQSGSPFYQSIGARAFLAATTERFIRRRTPLLTESALLADIEAISARYGNDRRLAFVIDEFFTNPDDVPSIGLQSELGYYEKGWFTTAVTADTSASIKEEARRRLEEATGLSLPESDFHGDCSGRMQGWNGAFNAKLSENLLAINACNIHNHADPGRRGWAAVVYLTPAEVPGLSDESGTSLWLDHATSTCTAADKRFDGRLWRYQPLAEVAPRYNRAVVFPSEALHRGEAGFGHDAATSRLFMTLFFESTA